MDTLELIRGYFNKMLSNEQEQEYLSRYNNDAEFKILADDTALEITGIREVGRENLKNKFSSWEVKKEKIIKINQETKSTVFFRFGIAASFVLMVGLYFSIPREKINLYDAYFEPYENFEYTTTRNDASEIKSDKILAYGYYDQGSYKIAVEKFTILLESDPNDIASTFFRGVSSLHILEFDEALTDFKKVTKSRHPFYVDASNWYMALIYIRLDQEDLSKTLLRKLSLVKGEYKKKAKELLGEL